MNTLQRKYSAGIIGYGTIGSRLSEKILRKGWSVPFIARSRDIVNGTGGLIGPTSDFQTVSFLRPDIVFLAIPTTDDGSIELRYIELCMQAGVQAVITCAKGARANHGEKLEPYHGRFADSASVGGGIMLVEYAKLRDLNNITRIDAVLNGTLNFLWNQLSQGVSVGEAMEEAKRRGIMEPADGASLMSTVISEGFGDVPKKIAILCKKLGICPETSCASAFPLPTFTESDLERVAGEAKHWRFVVTIRPKPLKAPEGVGICHVNFGRHCVSYGWQKTDGNSRLEKLIAPDAFNTILIEEGVDGVDGTYCLQGPGAGPGPTTAAMMNDAIRLLGLD